MWCTAVLTYRWTNWRRLFNAKLPANARYCGELQRALCAAHSSPLNTISRSFRKSEGVKSIAAAPNRLSHTVHSRNDKLNRSKLKSVTHTPQSSNRQHWIRIHCHQQWQPNGKKNSEDPQWRSSSSICEKTMLNAFGHRHITTYYNMRLLNLSSNGITVTFLMRRRA